MAAIPKNRQREICTEMLRPVSWTVLGCLFCYCLLVFYIAAKISLKSVVFKCLICKVNNLAVSLSL
jgi:hypothetical protein